MNYRVLLVKSEEGFAAFCPTLPGCVAQGDTEAEALNDFREAAALWIESGGSPAVDGGQAGEAELFREASADGLAVTVREVVLAVTA